MAKIVKNVKFVANKLTCPECGESKSINRGFYLSKDPRFELYDHRCYWCKDCLEKMCFDGNNIPSREKFREVLRDYLNLPFDQKIYEDALKKQNRILGYYITQLNTRSGYKNKNLTWEDGQTGKKEEANKQLKDKVQKEFENSTGSIEIIHGNLDEYESIGVEELRDRWGRAYPLEDLVWLEKKNLEWYDGYDIQGKSMELLVQQLCFEEFYIYKERQEGGDVSKRIKTLQDLLKNSNLSPRQETASDQAEFQTISEFIKKVEEKRPFIKTNPEFEDVDNFRKMWQSMAGAINRTAGKSDENTKVFEDFFKDSTMDFSNLATKEEE